MSSSRLPSTEGSTASKSFARATGIIGRLLVSVWSRYHFARLALDAALEAADDIRSVLLDLCTSTDTHRNELAEVKTFLRWCVKKGHLRKNPAEEIEGIGKRKKGKPQLRAGEAVEFLERALVVAVEGSLKKKPAKGKKATAKKVKAKSENSPPRQRWSAGCRDGPTHGAPVPGDLAAGRA